MLNGLPKRNLFKLPWCSWCNLNDDSNGRHAMNLMWWTLFNFMFARTGSFCFRLIWLFRDFEKIIIIKTTTAAVKFKWLKMCWTLYWFSSLVIGYSTLAFPSIIIVTWPWKDNFFCVFKCKSCSIIEPIWIDFWFFGCMPACIT